MSKEIAQTVGGKKFGLLLVVLAALAVIATLGSQWRGADAAITTSSATGAGTATPVLAGSTGNHYVISFTTDVAGTATAGDIEMVVDMAQLGTATAVTTTAGSLNCTIATNSYSTSNQADADKITGTGDVRCIWNGPVPAGVTGSIDITYTAGSTLGAQTPVAAICDNGDLANGATGCVRSTNTAVTVVSTASGLTKTPSTQAVDMTGAAGVTQTITWTNNGGQNVTALTVTDAVPAGVTVTAITSNTGTSPLAFNCTATPVVGAATVTCTSTAGTATAGQTAIIVLTETVSSTAVARSLVDNANATATFTTGGAVAATQVSAAITQGAQPITNVELKHVNEAGNLVPAQDIFNNVRGARHTACLFEEGTDAQAFPIAANGEQYRPYALATPLNDSNINADGSGGYKIVGDATPNYVDPRYFTSGSGNSSGASCFSWVSTQAGDQQLSVVVTINGSTSTFSWDTDADGDGAAVQSNRSLVKEWNVLETSQVYTVGTNFNTALTATSGAGTNNVTYALSKGLTLNPSSGNNTFSPVALTDAFLGSHVTSTGGTAFTTSIPLVGVNWSVTLSGCGVLTGNGTPIPTNSLPAGAVAGFTGTTTLNTDGTVGNQPVVSVGPGTGSSNCIVGSQSVVTFTGQEPGVLGSGPGNTVIQTVTIGYTQSQPTKQVLLAWAGQNVVIEHDWRNPAGDSASVRQSGCMADAGQQVRYVKDSTSPGNFVNGIFGATTTGLEAVVTLTGNSSQVGSAAGLGDAPARPQDACISRVLYESEDPGEVDIAMFFDATNTGIGASKVDVVIYYMKLNQVKLSLVNEVSKPTHNTTGSDYDPGNPWDASKDDADNAVDWNVSRDLLVRGRVTGWFINSNPSGRAADTSDPNNILPADRWVMPDDWARIAGGDKLANQFRKSYDLMFAPNNAAGIALATPTGSNITVTLATVLAGSGTGAVVSGVPAPILVNSTAGLSPFVLVNNGPIYTIGTTPILVCQILSANAITVQIASFGATCATPGGLGAAPAAGTLITTTSGAPFEGPYSLVDIPGFSAATGSGAALANGGTTALFRDTTAGDGVVDWWDAPMPPSEISVSIRGTGFLKQVLKRDVYYKGTANSPATQTYPNPYYVQNIPASPYQAAVSAGAGYVWNSWGVDGPNTIGCTTSSSNPCSGGQGPYEFWTTAIVGTNGAGVGDSSVTAAQAAELAAIRGAYGDNTIARDLVVYSDNHGEFMVTANGDFKTDLTACAANALGGGKLCATGDKVGVGTITAVADYPEFVKHFPVASNAATVDWTWGGYKDVTVEPGETDQFKYVVFHAMDRDGFCSNAATGAVLLHPVLTSNLNDQFNGNPSELVDFLIDSGDGIIVNSSNALGGVSGERGNLLGVPTFSVTEQAAAASPIKTFPLSSKAGADQKDECQAWIKISNSLLGVTNVLAIAHDDEGNIGFDRVIDLTGTTSYTLNFRWSLITWGGADDIAVADALKGGEGTRNPAGNDISAQVTAVYGWEQSSQTWLAFFPTGVNVPGANNLTALKTGQAYWIAIAGPGPVTWTVSTNVS